jgi:hypothetical protein
MVSNDSSLTPLSAPRMTGRPSPRKDRIRSREPSVLLIIGSITAIGVAALMVSAGGPSATTARPSAASAVTPTPPVKVLTTTSAAPIAAAQPTDPDPRVGAIFLGGSPTPTCSGSVLHSAAGDLILTAAHCLAEGVDSTFVPGFNSEAGPDNTWSIDAVYVDSRWVDTQDPIADYAIARVGGNTRGAIEPQVGGGLRLSGLSTASVVVAVTGYRLGADDTPIHCQTSTGIVPGGFLSLPCNGLVAGTSGAPWITGSSEVVGLTGGLQGGGCDDDVSYSPPFDEQITHLLARAEAGGPSDAVPPNLTDDCPGPP